ncbi:helix-turn-helix domain-containing protein, partial [Idiomarina sp. UBA4206]
MDSDRVSALIGQRVRQYRLNQDLTQEDLATLANVSLNAVKSAEGGKSTLPTYVAILQALGHIDNLLAAFPDEGVSP